MLFVLEQTFQPWYYRSIPHHLRRNPLPGGGLALNIARVISSDLIPQCTTYRACIQILVLLAVEDAVIDACIQILVLFCTSNPRGQTTFFASYVLEGNPFSPASIFFIF